MTKPFIKRKPFCTRPAAPKPRGAISTPPEFLDAAFLDTVSCFETLRIYGGRFFCLPEHLERLRETCLSLGRPFPFTSGEWKTWLSEACRASGYPDAVARVSLHWSREGGEGEAVAILRPFSGHPKKWYDEGVDFASTALRRPSPRAADPQLKVSQYASGVLAHLDGGERRAHELLFFGDTGDVSEGSVSNLFILRGGRILTPCPASGILKGVTRSVVMDLARRRGYPARETRLTRHDLYTAEECWMTNTSSEILPVTRIDGRAVGGGLPGPLTRRLAADFKAEIKKRLS